MPSPRISNGKISGEFHPAPPRPAAFGDYHHCALANKSGEFLVGESLVPTLSAHKRLAALGAVVAATDIQKFLALRRWGNFHIAATNGAFHRAPFLLLSAGIFHSTSTAIAVSKRI